MNSVYLLAGARDGFQYATPLDDDDAVSLMEQLYVHEQKESRIHVNVVTRSNDGSALHPSRFIYLFPDILCCTEKDLCEMDWIPPSLGKWISLESQDGMLLGLNCTRSLEALDIEKSEVVVVSGGQVSHVLKYEFFAELVRGELLFRIGSPSLMGLFCTEVFVQLAYKYITGIKLERVWNTKD